MAVYGYFRRTTAILYISIMLEPASAASSLPVLWSVIQLLGRRVGREVFIHSGLESLLRGLIVAAIFEDELAFDEPCNAEGYRHRRLGLRQRLGVALWQVGLRIPLGKLEFLAYLKTN